MRRGLHDKHDIKFERISLPKKDYGGPADWANDENPMKELRYFKGNMESNSIDNGLEVDFANELLGGGVLRMGMVQEEIMFLVIPECLIGLPISARMASN